MQYKTGTVNIVSNWRHIPPKEGMAIGTMTSAPRPVEVNTGKGAQGIKFKNKMIIMFFKGDLLVKLTPKRVDELISEKVGLAYDPGTGKIMKDRVLIPVSNKKFWQSICIEVIDLLRNA